MSTVQTSETNLSHMKYIILCHYFLERHAILHFVNLFSHKKKHIKGYFYTKYVSGFLREDSLIDNWYFWNLSQGTLGIK